mgnify:CR=1 FL=1
MRRLLSATNERGMKVKFEDLSIELQEKAKACNTSEEILALAKEEGYELPDEGLDAVSGGVRGGVWVAQDNCNLCKGVCNKLY